MSSDIMYITDDSEIIYNSSKNGKYFSLRNLKKNTFEIYEKSVNVFKQIISVNINENKFPETDSNKCFIGDKYAYFSTSDKICYLIDLVNKRKTFISHQSKIDKITFNEKSKTMVIILNQSDGFSLIKFFRLNNNFELEFICTVVDDEKKNIEDFYLDFDKFFICYENVIELRYLSKPFITNRLFDCSETISKILNFSEETNNLLISCKSGNLYKINFSDKSEELIIKPTSYHLVKIEYESNINDALVISTFDRELFIYLIEKNKLIFITEIPNIYLTSCCLKGDNISMGFLNGEVLSIFFENHENIKILKKFKIDEYSLGEECINNLWYIDLLDKDLNYFLGYQTTNGIFYLK